MNMKLSQSVQAPPRRVFQIASDFANLPSSIPGIIAVEMLTEGPVGKGTRFKESRKFGGRTATETMEVAEWTPPHGYVLTARSCGTSYRSEIRIEAEGAAGARVTMDFTGKPVTFLAKLMTPLGALMKGTMRKLMEQDLADLKAAAERAAAPASTAP